jgi:hypothetical protein
MEMAMLFLAFASAQSEPTYQETKGAYCDAITCKGSNCNGLLNYCCCCPTFTNDILITGGFYYGNESTSALCQAQCTKSVCSCFDWRDPTVKPSGGAGQPACRLTNTSTEITSSSWGYDAWVNVDKPVPGSENNYACRSSNTTSFPFCDVNLPGGMPARVKDLVSRLTNKEKAALLSGRSSAAVPRLGIPLFCWGQNAIDKLSTMNSQDSTQVGEICNGKAQS